MIRLRLHSFPGELRRNETHRRLSLTIPIRRFTDDSALTVILYFIQSSEHPLNVEVAGPESAAIGFTQIKVGKIFTASADGSLHGGFFDVEMKGVGHDVQKARSHRIQHGVGVGQGMIETYFQVVHGLNHAMDVLPFGVFPDSFQAIDNITLRTLSICSIRALTLNQP
jgi:hypothetical protein